jgi:GMP synthase-like glutamine amidotransferase
MEILIIDNKTKHLRNLKKLLSTNHLTILPFFSSYPNPNMFDLIVLSGGSLYAVMENPEKFVNEYRLIKESETPIIGICEGCEIIAYTFGSSLTPFKPTEKGIRQIEILEKSIFSEDTKVEVYEAHHWAITDLGRELTGLARSIHGWEIIKHKSKQIVGFQFHPEMMTNKLLGDDIFRKFVNTMTKNV